MDARLMLLVTFCWLSFAKVESGIEIEWYRTAQDTPDRLSKQPDLTFGADFPSEVTVSIKR